MYVYIYIYGFPGGSDGNGSTCNAGGLSLIPGSGRSPGEGNDLPTPVLLPREFHGQRSLEGYSLWGCKESDITEQLTHTHHTYKYIFPDSLFCFIDLFSIFTLITTLPNYYNFLINIELH